MRYTVRPAQTLLPSHFQLLTSYFLLLTFPFLLPPSAGAQPPSLIHYQGRLVDGTNLVNGTVVLYLNLYNAPVGGVLLYSDENIAQEVNDGLYDTMLGDGTVFGSLDRALTNNQVWLEVVVNAVTLTPRERLVAVPYARAVHGLLIRPGLNSVALNPVEGTNSASGNFSVIGGGNANVASGNYSAVGGGQRNRASLWYGTVGGGGDNLATISYATIGGGRTNVVSGDYGTIAGGWNNIASGQQSFVGGGRTNVASGTYSTVGGGHNNAAGGDYATIAGGSFNRADGNYAMIPGGFLNSATNFAFAAGRRAKAFHDASFVWADSTDANFSSTATNQFLVRASSGVGINTNDPQAMLHVAGSAMIGSNPSPAKFGMQRINTNVAAPLFTHPASNVAMAWSAGTDRVLSVSNGSPNFIQASISLMRPGSSNVEFVVRDLGSGDVARLTNSAASAVTWSVQVGSDAFPEGFTFQGSGFANAINGLVTYWE